jgi:heme-degrading monooxygenase HmoA
MYLILWEFAVAPQRVAEFRSIYSPSGEWAKLFAQAVGYLGTELLESCEDLPRFVTIDRWRDAADFAEFQQRFREPYAALDARCKHLTLSERKLGAFRPAGK